MSETNKYASTTANTNLNIGARSLVDSGEEYSRLLGEKSLKLGFKSLILVDY